MPTAARGGSKIERQAYSATTLWGESAHRRPAALLGVLASAVPAGAAPTAKGPKPTVTDFTATPTTLYDNGGMVTLSAVVSNATNCILSSKPAVKGLPAKIACCRTAW